MSARRSPSVLDGAVALRLRGTVRQVSYPGGFWRYAVAVGDRQFMVDDDQRREPGAAVGIRLPPDAIHLYSDRASRS